MSPSGDHPKAAFPTPRPDAVTQPFWDGVAEGRLLVQRCARCAKWIWQPRPVCSGCQAVAPDWAEVSGDGRILSWTVLRPPTLPAFAEFVPFVLLLVELDEGVRMVGYLVDDLGQRLRTDGAAEGVDFDRRVALRFHDQAGTRLPCWTLID